LSEIMRIPMIALALLAMWADMIFIFYIVLRNSDDSTYISPKKRTEIIRKNTQRIQDEAKHIKEPPLELKETK